MVKPHENTLPVHITTTTTV